MTSLAARYTPGWETTHNFGRFHHCSLFPVGNEKGQWVKILEISFGWWKIENLGSIWFLSIKKSHNLALLHWPNWFLTIKEDDIYWDIRILYGRGKKCSWKAVLNFWHNHWRRDPIRAHNLWNFGCRAITISGIW